MEEKYLNYIRSFNKLDIENNLDFENLSEKENVQIMKDKNFEVWKNVYEEFYGIPLEYTTVKKEVNDEI